MISMRLRKAGVLLMTLSILNFVGCGYLDNDTARTIETKMHEKYGTEFNVISIGNRYGTSSNDTVTAYCQLKDDDSFSFTVVMKSDNTIVSDDYIEKAVCSKVSAKIKESFSANAIAVYTFVSVFGGTNSESDNPHITIDEYVRDCKPAGFSADIILEDTLLASGSANAAGDIYGSFIEIAEQLPLIDLGMQLRFIPASQFDTCGEALMKETRISSTWFDDYTVTHEFIFVTSPERSAVTYEEVFTLINEKR